MTIETGVEPAGWPKAVGVLSMIFGILGLTCGVLGLGMMVGIDAIMGSVMGGQLPSGTPAPPFTPPLNAVMIASAVIGFGLNALLIYAAIQLMRRNQSGRQMHLIYAVIGVFAAFVGSFAGYQGQRAQADEMSAWVEQHGNANEFTESIAQSQKNQAQMQGPMQVLGLLIGLVVTLAWPVFCIIWFGMSKRVVPPAFEY